MNSAARCTTSPCFDIFRGGAFTSGIPLLVPCASSTNASQVANGLRQGTMALAAGDPARAEAVFTDLLAVDESPEALEGLAEAQWWQNKLDFAMSHHEKAYAEYRRRGDVSNASRLALFISGEYATNYGNHAAAQGWFARAERLLARQESGAAVARLTLVRAERVSNVDEALSLANEALRIAHACGDADNEFHAMAVIGRIQVTRGNVDAGMAYLDESMAAAMGGEVKSRLVVGPIYCCMLIACERVGDFKRAAEWCEVVDEFTRRYHYTPLFAFCRIIYANLLMAVGRWTEADTALQAAIKTYDAGHRAMAAFARSALAELRIRQGRLDDAQTLVSSCQEHPAACAQIVRLCLARGDLALAETLLARRIGEGAPTLANFALFDLRIDVAIARGNLDAADHDVRELATFATGARCVPLSVTMELAAARVHAARRDGAALWHLERALELLTRENLPFEKARAKAMIAAVLATCDPSRALTEARSALKTFEALGGAREVKGTRDLLRRLSVHGRTGPKRHGTLSKREEDVLPFLAAGLSNPEIASRLFLSAKTVEHHVSNILSKLGLRNRAQAAAWATKQHENK